MIINKSKPGGGGAHRGMHMYFKTYCRPCNHDQTMSYDLTRLYFGVFFPCLHNISCLYDSHLSSGHTYHKNNS